MRCPQEVPFLESVTVSTSLARRAELCGVLTEFQCRAGEFQSAPENSDGPQSFPMARWRIPTALRKIPTAHRVFQWRAGEFQRLSGNLRRPTEFSDGALENSNGTSEISDVSQSFPMARWRIPTGPRKFSTASRIFPVACWRIPTAHRKSPAAHGFSHGALENSREPPGSWNGLPLFKSSLQQKRVAELQRR